MKLSKTVGSAASLLICGTLACSSDRQPPRSPSVDAGNGSRDVTTAAAARNDRETTVRLSEEIMTECRFPASPSELPRFELDRATLRAPDKNVLDDVANCLKDGPLQNRTITIVGRADPRGTEDHNHELGASRAEAARNYLIQKGVSEQKLLVVSRGEEGAAGKGEDTWSLDRRVDLVLGDKTNRASINQNPPANANANALPGKAGSAYSDQSEGGPASGKAIGSSGPGTDSVSGK
jgi:outer membrane protein OmpA-like peptidoglycan-associated protein